MAGQALCFKACNYLSNVRSLLNIRPLNVNLLPAPRGLKQQSLEKLKLLKIPEKPKKPPTPYLRFVTEHRAKLVEDNPNLKPTEIIKKCAEDWKTVANELKEKYTIMYKTECEIYNEKILKYNTNLSPEQKLVIDEVEKERKDDKNKRKIKKIYKETNKPKRPMGPYAIYIKEQSKITNISPKDLMTRLKDDWTKLSDTEKSKYKNQYLREKGKYEEAMAEWESKMLKEGKSDLVRVKTAAEDLKPSRISRLKISKTE